MTRTARARRQRLAATAVVVVLLCGCTAPLEDQGWRRDPVVPSFGDAADSTARTLAGGLTGPQGQEAGILQPPSALRELTAREVLHHLRRPVAPLEPPELDRVRGEIDRSREDPFAGATMLVSLAFLEPARAALTDSDWFERTALEVARTMVTRADSGSGPGPVEWMTLLRLAEAAASSGRPATALRLRELVRNALVSRTDRLCQFPGPGESEQDTTTLVRAAAVTRLRADTGLCGSTRGVDPGWADSVVRRHCTAPASRRLDLFGAVELALAQRNLSSDPTDQRCGVTLRAVLENTFRSRTLMSGNDAVPLHVLLSAYRALRWARVTPPALPDTALARVEAAVALAGAPPDVSDPVAITESVLGSITSTWLGTDSAAVTPGRLRGLAAEDGTGVNAAVTRGLALLAGAEVDLGNARRTIADHRRPNGVRLAAHVEMAAAVVAGRSRCETVDVEDLTRTAAKVADGVAAGTELDAVQLVVWLTALARRSSCPSLRDTTDQAAMIMTDALASLGRGTTPEFIRIQDVLRRWSEAERTCRPTPTAVPPEPVFLRTPAAAVATISGTANALGLGPVSLTYLELRVQRLARHGCGHPLLAWFQRDPAG